MNKKKERKKKRGKFLMIVMIPQAIVSYRAAAQTEAKRCIFTLERQCGCLVLAFRDFVLCALLRKLRKLRFHVHPFSNIPLVFAFLYK